MPQSSEMLCPIDAFILKTKNIYFKKNHLSVAHFKILFVKKHIGK